MSKIGAAIVLVAALAAVVGPAVAPFDPAAQDLALRLAGPSAAHPFGLDELGRDILARVLAGARISFLVGLTVVTVSASVGTLLGALAGYFGGIVDDVISRVIDMLLAFPGLLLAIALVAVLGPSLGNVLFALTVIGWVGYARLVRGQVLRAREFEYVQAARALGAATPRILWRHVVPDGAAGRRRAGHARDGGRDHRRGGAELSRPRRAAAHAELGHDAERRPRASARRTASDGVSRPGDCGAGAGVQLPRRRVAGPDRSEDRRSASVGRRYELGVTRRVRADAARRSAGSYCQAARRSSHCGRRPVAGPQLGVGERREQPQIALGSRTRPAPATWRRSAGSFSRSESAAMRVARGTNSRVVGDERAVVDQRVAGRLEVVLALGGGRVEQERRRIDGEAGGRLLQRALGASRLRHPAAARDRRATSVSLVAAGPDADALERLERLAERRRDRRALRGRPATPGRARRRPAAGRACARARVPSVSTARIGVARARVGQADRDLTLDVVAVEAGEHLQLLEFVGAAARRARRGRPVPRAPGSKPGASVDGAFEGALRLDGLSLLVAQAHAEQVVRVGRRSSRRTDLAARGERRVDVAVRDTARARACSRRGRSGRRGADALS